MLVKEAAVGLGEGCLEEGFLISTSDGLSHGVGVEVSLRLRLS